MFLQKKTPKNIHEDMFAVYHNDFPSYEVVKHWCRQFKYGCLSIHDEARSGRPSTSCEHDMIQKVEKIIVELGISRGSVFNIMKSIGKGTA